ncbi:MAG: hypothetical protein ABIO02_03955 [Patescibacteria group bacterium]
MELLNDLRNVGNDKPLGYLPLTTLIEVCKVDPQAIRTELENRGLKTIVLKQEECSISGGALFAYHQEALEHHLEKNKKILLSNGWPTEPEKFIRHLNVVAAQKTELFNVIADAYGDKTNPGRKE